MFIQKQDGAVEPFSMKKLKRSLMQAGASKELANTIASEVRRKRPKTTRAVYEESAREAFEHDRRLGLKYNIKKALAQLGPSGFPFEQFVAGLMQDLGWHTRTNQTLQGLCVSHEIDILMTKEQELCMVECKFRNQPGSKVDVKVPMYIKSRFDDAVPILEMKHKNGDKRTYSAMIATNSKFTGDAIRFGECAGIRLLSYGYPAGGSLRELILQTGISPITVLPHLTMKQKRYLTGKGVVLCRQLAKNKHYLKHMGLSPKMIRHILEDVGTVCKLPQGQK